MPKARSRSAIDDVGLQDLRHRPGDVVAIGRGADAALGADEGDRRGRPDRCRDRCRGWRWLSMSCIGVERRDQIFADAALHQLAIEHDVVGVADDDHLGAGVADSASRSSSARICVARQAALDDDQVGRRVLADNARRPPSMPPMCTLTCALASRRSSAATCTTSAVAGVLAEGLDRDARDRPRLRRAPAVSSARRRAPARRPPAILVGDGIGLLGHAQRPRLLAALAMPVTRSSGDFRRPSACP